MDSILFLICLGIVFYGTFIQAFKIFRNKSSFGVSYQATLISIISNIVILYQSQNGYLFKIAFFDFIIMSFLLLTILYFRPKNDIKEPLDLRFILSFSLSFLSITGVSQSIKSFLNKTNITYVSISAYSSFLLLKLITLYFAENILLIIAFSISSILFSYIIIDTFLKTRRKSTNHNIKPY